MSDRVVLECAKRVNENIGLNDGEIKEIMTNISNIITDLEVVCGELFRRVSPISSGTFMDKFDSKETNTDVGHVLNNFYDRIRLQVHNLDKMRQGLEL